MEKSVASLAPELGLYLKDLDFTSQTTAAKAIKKPRKVNLEQQRPLPPQRLLQLPPHPPKRNPNLPPQHKRLGATRDENVSQMHRRER